MILYKKDSKLKTRILNIVADKWKLLQSSGILWGKMVEHSKECNPTNEWRANERTSEQQAEFEAAALIEKKIREWYCESLKDLDSQEIILPMLAHSYEKYKDKIDWQNAFVQPKLDGMRCLAIIKNWEVKLISRGGTEITTMDHIKKELSQIKKDIILDWELYVHGESFQDNMKLIKKYRPWESERIKYHVYDSVSDHWFAYRLLDRIYSMYVDRVQTYVVEDMESVISYHAQFIELWFEGTIIRHWKKWYSLNSRDSQLLKYKDFKDDTYEVIDIVPMEVYRDQWLIVCKTKEGRDFRATPKMTHDQKKDLLINKDKYIWQTAEIRFFEYTDSGIPRFPVCVWFRLDK